MYSAMIKRLYMELVDEYDEADACATSHEDWEADSQGHPSLDRAQNPGRVTSENFNFVPMQHVAYLRVARALTKQERLSE